MAKITDIMLLQQPEQQALVIEHHADMKTFGELIGKGFCKIGAYLDEMGVVTSDIPFVIYPAYGDMNESHIHMVIGFYVTKTLPGKDDIKPVTIPARKIAVCLHKGDYNELAQLYNEMEQWAKDKGYEASGTSIEHYYTGPEVPEAEQVTRIVMPLK